ncbi:unnamed protein product [Knipowitschia caucasica]|uniref:Potassium channel domain-containing protein n=1 Tax=Knipowitschia caucasica TaxID=637954 RepID=A0AAV2JPD7_KNICA
MSSPLPTGHSPGPESQSRPGICCGLRAGLSVVRSRRVWRVVPHLVLILTLVSYAALGALLFWYIEGGAESNPTEKDYKKFLQDIVQTVQNQSDNTSLQFLVSELQMKMENDFQSIWLQSPKRWNYSSSIFFCCTVFTTVGYGELYPVTWWGKLMCVLYAMVGVPLMLLVILDVGDFLALLMTRAYRHLYRLLRLLKKRIHTLLRRRRRWDLATTRTLEDGTLVLGKRNMVIERPLDIRQVMRSQVGVRQKSIHLQNNKEIFEKILLREQLLRPGALSRSVSCPELDRLPRSKKPFVLWDFSGLGEDMDNLDVPFLLILPVVFGYVLLMALVLPCWETELSLFDAFYFCFITITTIGFGDIVPKHPNFFMLTSVIIICGMAIVSMAFKLSQSKIVSVYRGCIQYVNPRKEKAHRDKAHRDETHRDETHRDKARPLKA